MCQKLGGKYKLKTKSLANFGGLPGGENFGLRSTRFYDTVSNAINLGGMRK
jgi:hypothetical protein